MTELREQALIVWADRDRARPITFAAVLLLVAAIVLRIVGVPPIDVHGLLHYLGIMDPLCGGTRAMFLLTSGEFGAAAHYNPVVFPIAAAGVVLLARATVGWITQRWLDVRLPRIALRIGVALVLIAFVALGARQQLHAEMLMRSWS